jgi:hypothetical protein
MKFGKLFEHLRQQHWSAIVIELLIVVLGVFIGLQADAWNQGRRDHERERAYLGRISKELDESITSIQRSIELTRKRMAMDQLLIDSVDHPELVRGDPGRFLYAVTRGGYTFAPNVHGYTFEEIKSNGELGIFTDPKLSLDLMAFYSDVQQKAQWNYLRSLSQFEYIRRSAGILSAGQLALEADDADSTLATEDVEGAMAAYQRMLARPEFVEWVPVTLDYRRTDLEYGKQLLKSANALRDRAWAEWHGTVAPQDSLAPAATKGQP